jgi:hypothetical protein
MIPSLSKPHNQRLFRLLGHQQSSSVCYTSVLPKQILPANKGITNHLRSQLQLLQPTSQAPSLPTPSLLTATSPRTFSATAPRAMASDEDYMAFLNKANKDPSEGYEQATTTSSGGAGGPFKTTDSGVEVPKVLLAVTRGKFYVSDADEPWEAVGLGWNEGGRGLPDEGESSFLFFLDPFHLCCWCFWTLKVGIGVSRGCCRRMKMGGLTVSLEEQKLIRNRGVCPVDWALGTQGGRG